MAREKKQRRYVRKREFIRLAIKEDCGFIRRLSGKVFSIFGDYEEIISQWFVNPDVITLCGAGISRGEDVTAALKLGTDGVLVASGIVNANNPYKRLLEFVEGTTPIRVL